MTNKNPFDFQPVDPLLKRYPVKKKEAGKWIKGAFELALALAILKVIYWIVFAIAYHLAH